MYTFTVEVPVRLVNGSTVYEGRVEVYHNGEWGTVRDYGWDMTDAQVVCSELGYGYAIAAQHNAFYGQGSGQIWFNRVNCVGTEDTIKSCFYTVWSYRCIHRDDASVKCSLGNLTAYCIIEACTYIHLCITRNIVAIHIISQQCTC